MAWQDRVREGAYTPPSGIRMTFLYEDVSRETDKRTALFQFPGVDGGYVQDNGYGVRRYPLRCFFTGESHDLAATAFEVGLLERGIGRLDHPFYGSFDAIPYGTITRRDDLKTGANQSIVEVTFFATLEALYPSGLASPRNELLAALDAIDLASSEEFAEQVDSKTAAARAVTKSTSRDLVRLVADAMGGAADAVTAADTAFRDAQSAINYGIDLLVGQPLQLAQQVINLLQAPARAVVGIEMRLAGYRDLAERIFTRATLDTFTSPVLADRQLRLANDFRTSDFFAQQAVGGSLRTVYETRFEAKPAALNAAEEVLMQFRQLVAWREYAVVFLGLPDPGRAQQALQHGTARAVGYLIEASFALATERRLVLDRPRTIIDVAAEVYGAVDSRLDSLISTNELSGSEILELPAGASIAYYT